MRNIRLTIEFDGSDFFGWQFQPNRPTIQAALQSAVERVTKEKAVVYGCSRTDSGVSARNYVANFHTDSRLPVRRIPVAINANLPATICVKSAEDVGPEFHARFSARGKTYEYLVVMGRSPLRRAHAWELYPPADPARMARALRLFSGERDFRAFCHLKAADSSRLAAHGRDRFPVAGDCHPVSAEETGGCTSLPRPYAKTPAPSSAFCTLTRASLAKDGDEILVTIRGNRFLYKMVRRIVGAAVTYGAAGITLADIRAALAGREHQPFQTAPASGLILDSVRY